MSDGKELSFLDEPEADEPEVETSEVETPEPDAVESEAVEAVEEPQEAVAEPETGEQEAVPPTAEPEPQAIPVTALLDEREKRQAAERQAKEYQARLQAFERQRREAQKAPDWYEDPAAAAQHQNQVFQQQLNAQRLQQSKFFVEREKGAELVNEAMAYFDQNPQYTAQFMQHPSPFHAAVEFYEKQKFLNEVGDDPGTYINQRVEEELQKRLQAGVQQTAKPKAPPASLASAPATGGDAIAPGNAFDQMLPE